MNPYYYLFYKLNYFLNKKGDNEWGAIYALTVLVGLNIVVIYINVFNITKENSQGSYKVGLIIIGIVLFITNFFLFLNKKRRKEIENRYKEVSIRKKKIGSYIIIFYIILTIGSIFFA